MNITSAIRRMVEAGLTYEQAIIAAEAFVAENSYAPTPSPEAKRNLGMSYKAWRALRQSVFIRDQFQCVYCGIDVRDDPQCDHIIPLSQGGETVDANLATSCKSCNSSKKDRLVEEWRR